MAWIKTIPQEDATGFLQAQYEAIIKHSRRIWNILAIMSLNPPVLRRYQDFHGALMRGRSPLSRGQREMLAVVVSAENGCLY
jgi:alkylhydroperoxidase family enzyme